MKRLKKWMTLLTLVALTTSSSHLAAQEDCMYTGGNGYTEYRTVPLICPAIIFGALAITAILIVALQNSSNNHGH